MIILKNKKNIEKMSKAGKLLAQIMKETETHIVPGKTTLQIDNFIETRILQEGLRPECKGYGGYKHATCISLNDVIVHGVPSEKIILKSGDFVKIDVVASYKGYCVDMTRYFFVDKVEDKVKKIALVAQSALDKAIETAIVGNKLSDISACIQEEVEGAGFSIIRSFAGHGIGKQIHEDPEIPNYGKKGLGPILQSGMTLAIEPMIAEGSFEVKVMHDGWTAKTLDGGLAAHVEDTVLIADNGPVIFTRI